MALEDEKATNIFPLVTSKSIVNKYVDVVGVGNPVIGKILGLDIIEPVMGTMEEPSRGIL